MTPEQQRIAIAETCGWTWNESRIIDPSGKLTQDRYYYDSGDFKIDRLFAVIPNYLNDLNAMHEAEKVLFARNDWSVCKYDELLGAATSSWKWNATAAQRAEAFLRTIKKWEETP